MYCFSDRQLGEWFDSTQGRDSENTFINLRGNGDAGISLPRNKYRW